MPRDDAVYVDHMLETARKAIESLIGLDEHYRVEEQTVERSGG